VSDLAKTLGGPLPAGLDDLPADVSNALADAVRSARKSRRARLDEAIGTSLKQLPALIRGPVRRALGI
jgi:hypothetical protein